MLGTLSQLPPTADHKFNRFGYSDQCEACTLTTRPSCLSLAVPPSDNVGRLGVVYAGHSGGFDYNNWVDRVNSDVCDFFLCDSRFGRIGRLSRVIGTFILWGLIDFLIFSGDPSGR